MTIHIIGAGPSGISLAYFLSEKGLSSEVYESRNKVGGMSRSWNWNDCILDTGPHIFHTPDPIIQNLWESVASDLLTKGEYYSANLMEDNTLHPYPVSKESIKLLPQYEQILSELDSQSSRDIPAESFKDYVTSKMGETLTSLFFKGYPEKLWGIKTSEMSAKWAPQRICLRETISPFYTEQYSAYGKFGTGAVLERFHSRACKKSNFHLNETITELKVDSECNISEIHTSKRVLKLNKSDFVVSTLPLPILCKFLGEDIPLKFRGIHTTYIKTSLKQILPDPYFWLYIPSLKYSFNRITEASKFSPHICPEGYSMLSIETVINGGPHSKNKLDNIHDSVIQECLDFDALQLVEESNYDSTYNYEPYVYPIEDLQSQNSLTQARSVVDNIKNLYALGCGGEFHYGDMQIFFSKAQDLANDLARDSKYLAIKSNSIKVKESMVNNSVPQLSLITNKPKIIAEIGLNHSGNINLAVNMIDSAINSGADIVKFQFYNSSSRYSTLSRENRYAEIAGEEELTLGEEFERSRLSKLSVAKLVKYCESKSIDILFSAFDIESFNYLLSINVKSIKVASMDLNNVPLHMEIINSDIQQVFISTGMSSYDEIKYIIDLYSRDASDKEIIFMHCTSIYPCPDRDLNLNSLTTLKSLFPRDKFKLGLSDHSSSIYSASICPLFGVEYLEKHFTINKLMPGPDNAFSITPTELKELVSIYSKLKTVTGTSELKVHEGEMNAFRSQKKSLYYRKDFVKGHILTLDDFYIVAPPFGINPIDFQKLSSTELSTNVKRDEPCLINHLS